jgi:hypothetical protein
MRNYANLSGDSGVSGYDIGAAGVIVRFVDGTRYRYTAASAGAANLKEMKRLAEAGRGLSTFIATVVKDGYESKWT